MSDDFQRLCDTAIANNNRTKATAGNPDEVIESLYKQLTAKTAECERLRESMQNVINGDYPHPRRVEQCVHGKYGYEECTECVDDYLQQALAGE